MNIYKMNWFLANLAEIKTKTKEQNQRTKPTTVFWLKVTPDRHPNPHEESK